ncbi:MAB_1171c family putative transporter [Nocardia pseudobrasiliensis]|uniref:MAB_1171c family putative transporter n=1 Tax=Nocardia pseudobrasiliensis TaxID=45979 RepID=UPI0011C01D14|nr:MAB_1171c family putative transporter [Nocardia pseudobrasiliensis]
MALLALLLRLPALFRRPEPGLAALCAYFVVSAFTFTMALPAIWVPVNSFLGVPNLTGLISQCGGLSIAVAQQAVVLAWASPWAEAKRKIYLRAALLLVALGSMVTLFAMSVPHMSDSPHSFVPDAAKIPTYSVYLIVFQCSFLIGTIESMRLCWRYSLQVGPGWLGRGLRTAALGSGLGLPYSAARIAAVFAERLGADAQRWEPIARLGASVGTLLVLIGWTVPTWGPPLSELAARIDRYRRFRRLGPLWRALYDAVPEMALTPPRRTGLLGGPGRRLDFRLYRRIVEIRDARMALLPFFSIEVADTVRRHAEARGLSGRRLDAAVEAANLAAAIAARKRWNQAATMPQIAAAEFDHFNRFGENLYDELDWLVLVGAEFTRASPDTRVAVATP